MNLDEVYLICITYIMTNKGNVGDSIYPYVTYRLEAHTYFQSYNYSLHKKK